MLVRVVHHLVADEAAQNIHKLTNKSESAKRRLGQVFKSFFGSCTMRSSLQIRCRVQSVQIFCILFLQMFLFAENGSRGPQRLCGC